MSKLLLKLQGRKKQRTRVARKTRDQQAPKQRQWPKLARKSTKSRELGHKRTNQQVRKSPKTLNSHPRKNQRRRKLNKKLSRRRETSQKERRELLKTKRLKRRIKSQSHAKSSQESTKSLKDKAMTALQMMRTRHLLITRKKRDQIKRKTLIKDHYHLNQKPQSTHCRAISHHSRTRRSQPSKRLRLPRRRW